MIIRNTTLFALALAIGILSAATLGLLVGPNLADAEGPTGKAAVTMTFADLQAGEKDGEFAVSVKLVSADGEPVSSQSVRFFVTPDFLGERPMLLLATSTDEQGTATATYIPSWDGEHRITARFAGNDTYAAAETITVLELSASAAVPPGFPLPVEPPAVLQLVSPSVVVIVLVIWLILALVLIRVGWGVWHSSRRSQVGPYLSADVMADGRLAGSVFDQ